jgi:uncharacterized protein (TIRG00374 family)
MRAGPDKDVPAVSKKRAAGRRGWRNLKMWLPHLIKPLRRGALVFILLLVVEYLVVPELVGASKDLHLLGQMNIGWLITGVVMEIVSLFCYAVLTKVLLPPGRKPSLSRLFRIDLSAAAVAHVIPAGTVGTAALGFRLFTNEGISGNDAAVMMAAKGLGSTVVLNVLLWLSLVVSIPLAGFRPIYGTVAIIGTIVLLGVGALVFGVTRGVGTASRVLHAVGDKLPFVSGERIEQAIQEAARTLSNLGRDKRVLFWALTWAALNWLLDAASLWCFIAAFGQLVNPIELFAAYGIANVAGVLPITPGGLGVVDSVAPLLLVGFGVTRSVATLGVIGWRLVNFWLPIPAGAASYVSLKVEFRSGWSSFRSAVASMFSGGDGDAELSDGVGDAEAAGSGESGGTGEAGEADGAGGAVGAGDEADSADGKARGTDGAGDAGVRDAEPHRARPAGLARRDFLSGNFRVLYAHESYVLHKVFAIIGGQAPVVTWLLPAYANWPQRKRER